MPGLSNALHREFLSAPKDLEYHVHFSQFFTKNEHAIAMFWKPQHIQKVSHLKGLVSKIICTKFLSPISCHSWEIGWFIFNELTVHSTRSPDKHWSISKRKILPDSGNWALSSQACARKIWDIRAHPNCHEYGYFLPIWWENGDDLPSSKLLHSLHNLLQTRQTKCDT
jgi:hypothetical protein